MVELTPIEKARLAAVTVLDKNSRGPYRGLPRTAGWGYPEPYTRDLMIATLGILLTGNGKLIDSQRRLFRALARVQSPLGQIPGLAIDGRDLGSSDSTPLFLIGLAICRRVTGTTRFLDDAAGRALDWMKYRVELGLVPQRPTTDWRDEQWFRGYGLYVNALAYACLVLWGRIEEAEALKKQMNRHTLNVRGGRVVHKGLVIQHRPYYAPWVDKVFRDERSVDVLGNSLAILFGIASQRRANRIIQWIEAGCQALQGGGNLVLDLPPCMFPFIEPEDDDWRPRYEVYNRPGEYHNGGVWPFVCGFYIAALVAAGRQRLAREKLNALTELVRPAKAAVDYGFNEWYHPKTGQPRGEDWQSWSAAMYLYAAACVEQRRTPFFDEVRGYSWR
jgi:hypothetical protein